MATKAQLAAVADAQKAFDTQLKITQEQAKQTNAVVGKTVTGAQSPATPIPTVTIGGAPAGYSSPTLYFPTFTSNGVPMGYNPVAAESYGSTTVPGLALNNGIIDPMGSTTPQSQVVPMGSPESISKEDALFNAMMEMMKVYNIQNFASTWAKIRKDYPGISSAEALDLLRYDGRYNADYTQRFSGNQTRIKNGLGAVDEKTYLEMERGYSQVFKNYSLPTFDNAGMYSTLIGNGVNVVEAGQRVSMAYDRVLNSDPGTLDAWRKFYPQLNTADLVATMLDPKNQVAVMERKVQAAEIGGAALTQGLNASMAAETIQSNRYSNLTTGTIGADAIRNTNQGLPQTKTDYEKIAGQLPVAEKLSSIYGGQLAQYGQVEAEKANILGLASEKRKLEDLVSREQANYQGSSGTSKGAFSTQYLNRQGKSGAF
jgi:hypothetical protein